MRIEDMITQDKSNWYFNNFSPLLLLKMYRDNKWEFEFWLEFTGLSKNDSENNKDSKK